MKYIDAEKLIKAIEEKGLDCSFALKMERLDTLALIDELQQEPEEKTFDDYLKATPAERRKMDMTKILGAEKLAKVKEMMEQEQPEFPTTDEQVKEFLAVHPKIEVPEKYKNPDWLFKKQELPSSSDLDEAAQKVEDYYDVGDEHGYLYCHRGDIKDAFIAGAKWQYQKDRGEFAKIIAKTWCEGFDAHKEQMLKEAVEGEYGYFSNASKTILPGGKLNLKEGDKVKIIIVKED